MALYFIDSTTGNDGDSGLTLDLAFATIEHFYTAAGLSAGDYGIVRRLHSETPGNDIVVAYSGTFASPITLAGKGRAAFSITSASWTNGSTTVDNILPASLTRKSHQGRLTTGPDGELYLITRVVDANTCIIEREYVGASVTLLNGAATINADPAQALWDAYDDSADTIKKADWATADSDNNPTLDFNDGDFQLYFQDDMMHIIENLEIKDSLDSDGIIRVRRCQQFMIKGCLLKQSAQNKAILNMQETNLTIERCIFEGSGAGNAQRGVVTPAANSGRIHIKDSAIYNMGDNGMAFGAQIFVENVNIGVEIANGDDDISMYESADVYGRGLKLGGTNGIIAWENNPNNLSRHVSIENYGKILGKNYDTFLGGIYEIVAVAGETPNKKVSDNVLKVTPNIANFASPIEQWHFPISLGEIENLNGATNIKFWLYNDLGQTINDTTAKDNVYIKAEYIKAYDDTTEYVVAEAFSTEIDILDAADADDWDSLSVAITTALASKVRLTLYVSIFDVNDFFIDPAAIIS